MNENFFSQRLARLRNAKAVSAREMSLSIGQNKNYINQIENQKMFPTMQNFFYICEYLGVAPSEFFDEGNRYPERLSELVSDLQKLDEDALAHVAAIVRKLAGKKPPHGTGLGTTA